MSVLVRRCVTPLFAVLLIACASEAPPSNTPASRSKAKSAAHTTPSASAQEGVPASPAVVPHEDSDALAQRLQAQPALTRFSGQVSYYSNALAGHSTASGEPYEPSAYTAAHRSLPFGTIVRVVSDQTGRTVYVRINDRGPFVHGRVLDLSHAAAKKLGLLGPGVLEARAEVVENGPVDKRAHGRSKTHKSH
jgi:rare lipoprotein A